MTCVRCGNKNKFAFQSKLIESDPNLCWNKEACDFRSDPNSPFCSEDRECITTDIETMYIALKEILTLSSHDDAIYLIAAMSIPGPQ